MNELVKNKKKWELLAEQVMKLNYEDILYHETVSKIIEEPYKSSNYYSAIKKAKKYLLTQGKDIEVINGQGYKVVAPDDYTNKSIRTFKQGFNRLDKAKKILAYAPQNHMSQEGLSTYRTVSDRVSVLHASMAGACTELHLLSKKETNVYRPTLISSQANNKSEVG